jgi:hypothetical protein
MVLPPQAFAQVNGNSTHSVKEKNLAVQIVSSTDRTRSAPCFKDRRTGYSHFIDGQRQIES